MYRFILAVFAMGLPTVSWALPAEIVILMDTSRSMEELYDEATGATKLDRAKQIASELTAAAAAGGHRVGLYRFRQLEAVVQTGTGQQVVLAEDDDQCLLAGDLLVPVEVGSDDAILTWLDGIAGQGEPELQPLGDSPLYRSVRLVLGYLRARRLAQPIQSCVNATVVIITDGTDTCAAGSELANAVDELQNQSVIEDIRGLVISTSPESEASVLLAELGFEPGTSPGPFGFDDASAAVAFVEAIEGRPAPEACLLLGIEAEALQLQSSDNSTAGDEKGDEEPEAAEGTGGSGGCQATHSGSNASWLVVLAALMWVGRRRWHWVVAIALAMSPVACSDSDSDPEQATEGGDESGETEGGSSIGVPPDPSDLAAEALARQAAIIDALEVVREDHLVPLLDPATHYEAITGDALQGCLDLAHSIAYTPTRLAELGPAGCIATGRCNSIDHALLVQDCLAFHGIEANMRRCTTPTELKDYMRVAATEPKPQPDVQPALDAIRAAVDAALEDSPEVSDTIEAVQPKLDQWFADALPTATSDSLARLLPLSPLDPAEAHQDIDSDVDTAISDFYYLEVEEEPIDPTFADSPFGDGGCSGGPIDDPRSRAISVEVTVLARYYAQTSTALSIRPAVEIATLTYYPFEHFGERLDVVIAEAGSDSIETFDDIPAPALSPCLTAQLRIGDEIADGLDFFVLADDADACEGEPIVELEDGLHLARITLRSSVKVFNLESEVERNLIDRYGYASTYASGGASGPIYSAETLRTMAPMRVDMLVGSGIPNDAWLLDQTLADIIDRREVFASELAGKYGVQPDPDAPPVPELRRPYDLFTLSSLRLHMDTWMPAGAYTRLARPWRLATVRRRGFGEVEGGIGIRPTQVFDIVHFPVEIVAPEGSGITPEERLEANMALGILATEAEGLASMAWDNSRSVINAAAMLRDDSTGPWGLWDEGDEFDKNNFPVSVTEAAKDRSDLGEELITTAGAAPYADGAYIAWWRIDRSGFALGEIRYDGTFYGGATSVAKAVALFNYCMAAQAVAALTSPQAVIPDVDCCLQLAAESLVTDVVLDWGKGAAAFGLGYLLGGIEMGLDVADAVETIDSFISFYDFVSGEFFQAEDCL